MVTKLPSTALSGKTATLTGVNLGEDNLTVYDEGTWTPVVKAGTTDITTGGSTSGKFTRVGNVVNITCTLAFNRGSNTGTITVSGLPVAAASSTTAAFAVRLGNAVDSSPAVSASVAGGASVVDLHVQPDSVDGTLAVMTEAQIKASTAATMIITGFYFV